MFRGGKNENLIKRIRNFENYLRKLCIGIYKKLTSKMEKREKIRILRIYYCNLKIN